MKFYDIKQVHEKHLRVVGNVVDGIGVRKAPLSPSSPQTCNPKHAWSVDHVASGLRICLTSTRSLAKELRNLLQQVPDTDWEAVNPFKTDRARRESALLAQRFRTAATGLFV